MAEMQKPEITPTIDGGALASGRPRSTAALVARQVLLSLELPEDLRHCRLPRGVDRRLQELLDRQDRGDELTPDERREAEGLVDLAEFLSLLRLRAERVG